MKSRLLDISIKNLGCIGPDGLTVALDKILCLVGNNNAGKSTVLRAYELAVGSTNFDLNRDRCLYADGNTEVVISVHIPEGVGNIAEKWKHKKDDLRIVRSKWTWDERGIKTRKTFNPETADYSENDNASGLDSVFQSRLPKPFRVGALTGPNEELKNMLKLIVDPLKDKLAETFNDPESPLSQAYKLFNDEAAKPIQKHAEKINNHNRVITDSHSSIFPNLKIEIKVGLDDLKWDPEKALVNGSTLQIREHDNLVEWDQQGTGSQRALFWSLLQVRSKLQANLDLEKEREKQLNTLRSKISKLERESAKSKNQNTRDKKQNEINTLNEQILIIQSPESTNSETANDVALPGYMLLIDEPEIALHPNGIRSACKYLYDLAEDPSWQIMLTTHSPLFIDPFRNSTTIVRLTKTESSPSPNTYRSDEIEFSDLEREQLTLLNTFDQNMSEMFFGQHPIIIEGDTEFAAFHRVMELSLNKYPKSTRPLLIRARGKFPIIPVQKMLNHFKVDYSVLHDSDYPWKKDGNNNGVWTCDHQITELIQLHRTEGRKVIHRISISTFEVAMNGLKLDDDGKVLLPSSKEKPFQFYTAVKKDKELRAKVEALLDELLNPDSRPEPFNDKQALDINEVFKSWAEKNGVNDVKFIGPNHS